MSEKWHATIFGKQPSFLGRAYQDPTMQDHVFGSKKRSRLLIGKKRHHGGDDSQL